MKDDVEKGVEEEVFEPLTEEEKQDRAARWKTKLAEEATDKSRGNHFRALRIRKFHAEVGHTPGCIACETDADGRRTGAPGRAHTEECKAYQDMWEHQEMDKMMPRTMAILAPTAPNEPSGSASSSSAMPATTHREAAVPADMSYELLPYVPPPQGATRDLTDDQSAEMEEETAGKKARVVNVVLNVYDVKFDRDSVNEEITPTVRASDTYSGELIDGLPAEKVKKGDERELKQMDDLQLYSWVRDEMIPEGEQLLDTGWARRLKGDVVRSRCVLKDFATTCSRRHRHRSQCGESYCMASGTTWK